MRYWYFLIFGLFVTLVFWACASVATLSGGPKDETPPKLDSLKSTQNYQTNFRPSGIVLHFDEWITLRNINQILISPPLSASPVIKQRGKRVTLDFVDPDDFRENTTYNINFGNSIVDFTEGNPYSNFSFIFSTGDIIDSLIIRGRVIDAYDEKPEKDALVMLYDDHSDSVVVKSRPYYFAYTDASGNFTITNIREGYYKVFALKDANANFLFDNLSERIAFPDTLVFITGDTISPYVQMRMYLPDLPLNIRSSNVSAWGKISLEYSRRPDSLIILESSVKILENENLKDSTFLWFDTSQAYDSIQLVIKSEEIIDTVLLRQRKKFNTPVSLSLISRTSGLRLHPDKNIELSFNQPVFLRDTSGIEVVDTSDVKQHFTIRKDPSNTRIFQIRGNWKQDHDYEIMVLPETFYGLHGQVNEDTIFMNFKTLLREDFGNLTCQLDSLDEDMQYIVRLLQKNRVMEEVIVNNQSFAELNFTGLAPGSYSLEVIIDENKNGRWNGGDYFKGIQAEQVLRFPMNELKKNWTMVEKFIIKKLTGDDLKN
jgi:uncharacterized protein (DUF2141 family)